jgi:hypothetical protein
VQNNGLLEGVKDESYVDSILQPEHTVVDLPISPELPQ